ncbi:12217_t:CDS:2, partial [Funneliformis geosporum]
DKSRLERFLKIKIKGIAHMFSNIIHLDFENGKCLTSKALRLIAESYSNLNDKGLYAIANSYHKLEYLNISGRTEYSEISICNIIRSCKKLQYLNLRYCKITEMTIEEISRSCLKLKYLNLRECNKISKKDAKRLIPIGIFAEPYYIALGRSDL